jgi:hypothetical protein
MSMSDIADIKTDVDAHLWLVMGLMADSQVSPFPGFFTLLIPQYPHCSLHRQA